MAQENGAPLQDDEIEPLSDEMLEDVAGGDGMCSAVFCSKALD